MGGTLRTRIRRTAVLAAAAGLLAVLPGSVGTAQASGTAYVGSFDVVTYGIPATIHPGQVVYAHTFFIDRSKYRLKSDGYGLLIVPPKGYATPTVQVEWRDPSTGVWHDGNGTEDMGSYQLDEPMDLWRTYAPNKWYRVDFEIKFGTKTPVGKWQVYGEGLDTTYLIDSSGHGAGFLDEQLPVNPIRVVH